MQTADTRAQPHGSIPSSSPAFATPVHPVRPLAVPAPEARAAGPPEQSEQNGTRAATVLPILLPPATLRPIAFRTFTKKHNLTLTSAALQALASFVGKHCGAAWREDGLAEMVLEEVARAWKKSDSRVIVDTEGTALETILKQLEGTMSGGRISSTRGISRQNSFANAGIGLERENSFGMSSLAVEDEDEEVEAKDARSWLKVVSAFEQPRVLYNASRKHFEKSKSTASFFPPPAQKTELFRQRYHIAHQRLLRNESFQGSAIAQRTSQSHLQQAWKITPIANLLGRSGSGHLLLGLLTIAPTGTLAISDLTGSIFLDLQQATPIDEIETWLCPGMIALVDGVYEEEYHPAGGSLGNMGGIGGTIGGRFIGFQVGAPRCETRASTLGISQSHTSDVNVVGGGFGWVDFLGQGSERAVGSRMKRLEQRLLLRGLQEAQINSPKMVIVGETTLDDPKTLEALRRVLQAYTKDGNPPPVAFAVLGNFVQHAAMAGGTSGGSIDYKENFNSLAALLSDFPSLTRSSTWIFVPGDNDPWGSSFSAGAASPLPQQPIPDLFSSRIRRVFTSANADTRTRHGVPGEAIWTTNPSRLSLFGPAQEIVVFRDDISGRLRRNSIPIQPRRQDDHAQSAAEDSSVQMSGALAPPEPLEQRRADETEAMQTDEDAAGPERSHSTVVAPAAAADDSDQGETLAQAQAQHHARAITKTLLDQCHLSPFPLSIRPQHWSYAPSALSLYPLPTALVLCDADAPAWALTYQGCHVMNCGRLLEAAVRGRGKAVARWVEYDFCERRGVVREISIS